MNENTNEFIEFLRYCPHPPYSKYVTCPISLGKKISDYLFALSDSDFRSLISDRFWNSYPQFRKYCAGKERGYFYCIFGGLKTLILLSEKHRKELILRSQGIFRLATLDVCIGEDKIKSAMIGLKSKDKRVRLASVKIVPTKALEKILLTETNESISHVIITRIGKENLKIRSKDVKSIRIKNILTDLEFMNSKTLTNESIEFVETKSTMLFSRIFFKVIYSLNPKELIFHLDMLKAKGYDYEFLTKVFIEKISKNNI